jgi:hypothetical protein
MTATVIPLRTYTSVSSHTRRIERDPAFIAMTERLIEEVREDHMSRMFDEAIRLAFPDDAARIEESF